MAPSAHEMRKQHNLLRVSELLDGGSLFSLVLDTIEQSSAPLVAEFVRRAKAENTIIVVITAAGERGDDRHADMTIEIADSGITDGQKKQIAGLRELFATTNRRRLIVCDCLTLLAEREEGTTNGLIPFLETMIDPAASVVGVYHTDQATLHDRSYHPVPLVLVDSAATAVIVVRSFEHILEERRARGRSREEPAFGVEQHIQGIIQGVNANGLEGLTMRVEHRQRTGKAIRESYYLLIRPHTSPPLTKLPGKIQEFITLLDDHPLLRPEFAAEVEKIREREENATFDTGLTDRQRRDRDGVVLPYYDAQSGMSDGGRILYDMGSEDDFDDEEDEV